MDDPFKFNPYAPPTMPAVVEPAPLSRDEALRRIQKAAWPLAIVALISVIVNLAVCGYFLLVRTPDPSPLFDVLQIAVTLGLLVGLPAVIAAAASCVIQGKVFPWCWIATVTSLIPLGSGMWCFEMFAGFWLLHVLLKPEIRAALRSKAAESPSQQF
jgi:hypothetical protein